MTRPRTATAVLGAGLVFLYAPIAVLIVYSFNASRLVSVWGGWSLHWYGELFRNARMLESAALSLAVAATAATIALILGALAGYAMARYARFPGRALFSGMLAAPLMLPEILTGISLLLLFVAVVGSILVSYVRARAEIIGLKMREGVFTRTERAVRRRQV